MGKDLEFRLFQKGDEQGLSHLFREVFEVEKDSRYWDWKYYQNPAGQHSIIVALSGGRVVGTAGLLPIKLKIGSTEVLSAQGIDVVVSPEYRSRGTFIKLSKLSIEECIRNGADLSYAFSIKITYRVCTKFLGYAGIFPVFKMTKILNPTPYLQGKMGAGIITNIVGPIGRQAFKIANKRRLVVPRELKINEVTHFDERFDDFWRQECKNYEIAVVRDSQYLNWRFIRNPSPYKIFCVEQDRSIKGFIVLKCFQEEVRRGRIIDIFVQSHGDAIIDVLLTAAINYFIDQGVDVVACWMLEHTPILQALKKRGFVKRETPHDLIVRSFTDDFPNEYFQDSLKWYVTMGDSDYFS